MPSLFAQRLQQALEARGLSQRELAEIAGVHPSTIYRWLYEGTVPRRAQLRAVAQALEVSEEWLAGKSNHPQINISELIHSIKEAQELLEKALQVLSASGVTEDGSSPVAAGPRPEAEKTPGA